MAIRLADSFVEGWFYNTSKRTVHGAFLLEGMDRLIPIELTGDPGPSLQGRGLHVKRAESEPPPVPYTGTKIFSQVGVPGTMELRMAKVPVGDYLKAYEEKRPIDYNWEPTLYLEWYGTNGRVVLELSNPLIELEKGPPFDDPAYPDESGATGFSITEITPDSTKTFEIRNAIPKPDYMQDNEIQSDDLDGYLDKLNEKRESEMRGEEASNDPLIKETEWGDDQLIEGNGEFLASLLDPEKLPPVEDVDEEKAQELVSSIIMGLAIFHVGIHLCEHCTWVQAYEFILKEILYEERVPPEIVHTDWISHYGYGEICPECEKEGIEKYGNGEEGSFKENEDDPFN
jgi:hypothetical protein